MIQKYGKYTAEWAQKYILSCYARGGDPYEYHFEGDLTDQVYQRIALFNGVTFAELKETFPDYFGEDHAPQAMCFGGDYSNIILWTNISYEIVDALTHLLNEGVIKMVPTTHLTYFVDGCALNLPLAKGRYKYTKPHWLPVTFSSTLPTNLYGRNAAPIPPEGDGHDD